MSKVEAGSRKPETGFYHGYGKGNDARIGLRNPDLKPKKCPQVKSSLRLLASGLLLLIMLVSCGIPQWKREHLSDPIMQLDHDADSDRLEQHMLPTREGGYQGTSASGGGCGC